MNKKLFALFVTLILWGSGFAGVRAGLRSYSPEHLVALRFAIASLVLLGYAYLTRMRLPQVKDLPAIALGGFLGISAYHLCLAFGQQTVTAGAASLLNASSPIFTALLAITFLGEKLTARGWLGIVISFIGAALISLGEIRGFHFNFGAVLILLAAISQGIYFILQKPLFQKYGAFELATYTIWSGTIALLGFLPDTASVRLASLESTLAIAYLGIFPAAIAYMTWTYTLSQISAAKAASYLYLVPFLAIAIAWIWLQELPSLLSIVGGIITLTGVFLVNLQET
ncbi:DMT family transporter [Scytonema millei]|uniref:DMT family transporter n=2 Tax=Cyanophyceae TaxID=3028117 RepID=A0A9X5I5V1_9CYAN|nr:DMT family transporter [Scytonema millei]NHC35897.1 DMT family transporter [Scytonema millei VB511283]